MDATRLDVKLFVEASSRFELPALIPVFHTWIQQSTIDDELLIDVTDYSHVIDGPGVLLVGHEAQYGLEQSKGRTGLLYSQRRARVDGFESALRYSLRHALRAASLLEKEESLRGKLKFSGQELLIRINDRLRAPNTLETWKAVEPTLRAVLSPLFGAQLSLEPEPPGLPLFSVRARSANPANIDTLLTRAA
jgi:hypothetical protein